MVLAVILKDFTVTHRISISPFSLNKEKENSEGLADDLMLFLPSVSAANRARRGK